MGCKICGNKIYAKNMCRKHYNQKRKVPCINCTKLITGHSGYCHQCAMKKPEVRQKISNKLLNRQYSEEQKKNIKEKKQKAINKHYASTRDKRIDKYRKQFNALNNKDISVDWNTFDKYNTKIRTIDKDYGEWWTTVSSLLHGVTHPSRSINKTKETCIDKYGTESFTQTKECQEKIKTTTLEKYGVKHFTQSAEYKEKYTQTCINKYGVKYYFASQEAKEKIKSSIMNLYGVKYITQSDYFKEQVRNTCIEKYGVEWTGAIPNAIDKRKATMLDRYGVENASQNKEIALRIAKSLNYSTLRKHWQTNEELICQGSYESRVVDYLNANQIEYLWQPYSFIMPNGKTYRPDAYLIKEDKWIEIKGYFRDDAKVKWNWFILEYPNSELWDSKVLSSKGII